MRNQIVGGVLLACVVAWMSANTPAYAEQFRPGEPVGFQHDGNWVVGTVVAVESGRIKIKAEIDGEQNEGVFALRSVVRPPWTSGFRFWSDTSRSFRVKAACIDVSGDKLRLRKEDGSEITVPIAKLSEIDRTFAGNAKKAKAAFLARNPPPDAPNSEVATNGSPAPSSSSGNSRPMRPPSSSSSEAKDFGPVADRSAKLVVTLDGEASSVIDYSGMGVEDPNVPSEMNPTPLVIQAAEPLVLPEGLIQYKGVMSEKTGLVLPADPDVGLALFGVEMLGEDKPAGFRWASFQKQTVSAPVALPLDERLFDYSVNAQRALFGSRSQNGYLAIYDLSAGSMEPELLARIDGVDSSSAWARLLPNDRVVFHSRKGFVVVNYSTGEVALEMRLPIVTQIAKSPLKSPDVSPDGRYLLTHVVNGVSGFRIIVDLESMQVVHSTRCSHSVTEHFSEDGRFLLSLVGSDLRWIDVSTWKVARHYSFYFPFAMGNTTFHQLNDRFLIDSVGRVLDLDAGYAFVHMDVTPFRVGWHEKSCWMQGDRALVSAASFRGNAVASIRLPGDDVIAFCDGLRTPGQFESLRPGSSVSIRVAPSPYAEQVREILEGICQANGWSIAGNSTFVLEADLPIQAGHAKGQYANRPAGDSAAKDTKFYYRLSVKRGRQFLWMTDTCYLVAGDDALTYQGAVHGDSIQGNIPAGLSVPNTLVAASTKSGNPLVLYKFRERMVGGVVRSLESSMAR